MLAKIYGAYKFQLQNSSPLYLLVMKNAIGKVCESKTEITHKFDLKGSLVNRQSLTSDELKLQKSALNKLCMKNVLKDRDMLHILKFRQSSLINITIEDKKIIMNAIKADIDFLSSNNIMDYSLLIAVENKELISSEISHLKLEDFAKNSVILPFDNEG